MTNEELELRIDRLERDAVINSGSGNFWMLETERQRKRADEAERDLERMKRLENYQVDQRVILANALNDILATGCAATSGSWVNVLSQIRSIAERALGVEPWLRP